MKCKDIQRKKFRNKQIIIVMKFQMFNSLRFVSLTQKRIMPNK